MSCTVKPATTELELHMSPISPFGSLYQPRPTFEELGTIPTSASVMASQSSCALVEVRLSKGALLPQPVSQPEPGPWSGRTP